MSSRIFSAVLCIALASCGGAPENAASRDGDRLEAAVGASAKQTAAERIPCSVGDAAYADVCTVERAAVSGSVLLTVRHPDGGFRRLRLSDDRHDVTAADGASPAQVIARGDAGIDVAIGNARYRLPSR